MSKLVALWNAEPVAILGLAGSIVVAAAQQVLGSGLVTSSGGVNLLNLVITLVPILLSLAQRAAAFSPATVSQIQAVTNTAVASDAPAATATSDVHPAEDGVAS